MLTCLNYRKELTVQDRMRNKLTDAPTLITEKLRFKKLKIFNTQYQKDIVGTAMQ